MAKKKGFPWLPVALVGGAALFMAAASGGKKGEKGASANAPKTTGKNLGKEMKSRAKVPVSAQDQEVDFASLQIVQSIGAFLSGIGSAVQRWLRGDVDAHVRELDLQFEQLEDRMAANLSSEKGGIPGTSGEF